MNIELTADAPSAPNTEQESSQLQIVLDIWPRSNWITGAHHDSQPHKYKLEKYEISKLKASLKYV